MQLTVLWAYSRKMICVAVASQIIFPAQLMLFQCLIPGFVSLYIYKTKTVDCLIVKAVKASINVSKVAYKSCALFVMLKQKSISIKYVYFHESFFSRAYLILAPKSDVPIISILLSKWT